MTNYNYHKNIDKHLHHYRLRKYDLLKFFVKKHILLLHNTVSCFKRTT